MADITNGFISALQLKQEEIKVSMVNGRFTTLEAYQRQVGIYQGLQQALDILNNLLEEKDSDEL